MFPENPTDHLLAAKRSERASQASLPVISPTMMSLIIRGVRCADRLHRKVFPTLHQDGDRGSDPILARCLQRLRAAQGTLMARKPTKQPRTVLVAALRRVLTSRTAVWLVLCRAEKRSPDDLSLLASLTPSWTRLSRLPKSSPA